MDTLVRNIALLAILFVPDLFGQGAAARFEALTIENGLSQNFISAILQDSRGVLWFGTKDGLNRYDGYDFTIFRYDPSDSASLSHNYITKIYETADSTLWIGTIGGLNRFDRASEKFTRFVHSQDDSATISSNYVSSFAEDAGGRLWIGTRGGGLNRFSAETFVRRNVDPSSPNSLSSNDIYSISRAGDGTLWIATVGGGLNQFDIEKGTVRRFRSSASEKNSLSDDLTYGTIIIRGSLYVGTKKGLDILDLTTLEFSHVNISDAVWKNMRVTEMMMSADSTLWLNAYGFIARFNPAERTVVPFSTGTGYTVFFQDRSGIVWIGTGGNGVIKYQPLNEQFGLRPGTMMKEILHSSFTTRFDPAMTDPRSILDTPDRRRILLRDGMLMSFTRSGKPTAQTRVPRKHDDVRGTHLLIQDIHGTIWCGIDKGIVRFDERTNRSERITLYPEGTQNGTRYHDISALFADRHGMIWAGTPTLGLIRFDPATGERKMFSHRRNNDAAISHDFILSIAEDPDAPKDVLWIGTDGGGLNRLDLRTERFTRFTEHEGLPSNVIYSILCDTKKQLWMSTNKGIVRFDPRTGLIRSFTSGHGLQSNEFNRDEYFRTDNGTMIFGGIKGYNVFRPEIIRLNTTLPSVIFTDLKLFNRSVRDYSASSVLRRSIGETDTVTLKYSDNIFSVEFAATEFTSPRANHFSYQLGGFSDEWIPLGSARSLALMNLDPGEYTLRVKASNSDGLWNDNPAALHLMIVPPYWGTWWFRSASFILLIGAVSGIVRTLSVRKLRRQMRELEQQRALENERLRISADMHDDLGGRLTNVGLLSDLARQRGDESSMKNALQTIASASREIIVSFDEIVWAVNPRYDTLNSLMMYIAQFSAQYLEKTGINCTTEIAKPENDLPLSADMRHNIYMIVKESLNNIVKYAAASSVHITFEYRDHRLTVTVRDNGKGFNIDEERPFAEGLQNMQRRAAAIGGTFLLRSEPGQGTMVTVSVPIISH